MEIKKAEFIRSFTGHVSGIQRLPEIALVGRSNVGKSSLINCLCQRRQLAKVSGTPGKTRLVNYFLINDAFYLVDLPGYGFANVSRQEQGSWAQMMEQYLSGSEYLKHLLLLLDIRREPSDDDKQMAYWLQHYGIPCTIVATKADKLSKSAARTAASKLSTKVGMTFQTETVLFSSSTKQGRPELLKRIGAVLNGTALEYQEEA